MGGLPSSVVGVFEPVRDPLHNAGGTVVRGSVWAARRLFAADSMAIGKKNNASGEPAPPQTAGSYAKDPQGGSTLSQACPWRQGRFPVLGVASELRQSLMKCYLGL